MGTHFSKWTYKHLSGYKNIFGTLSYRRIANYTTVTSHIGEDDCYQKDNVLVYEKGKPCIFCNQCGCYDVFKSLKQRFRIIQRSKLWVYLQNKEISISGGHLNAHIIQTSQDMVTTHVLCLLVSKSIKELQIQTQMWMYKCTKC